MIVARSLCRVLLHQRREVWGNLRLSLSHKGETLSNGLPVGLARSRTASRLLPAEHAIGGRSRRTKASKQKNPLIPAFSPGRQSLGIRNDWADACHVTERCALASGRPTIWRHCRHSDLGGAA